MDIDFEKEPIGKNKAGEPVYLRDIWPTRAEVQRTMDSCVLPEMFEKQYSNAFTDNEKWNAIKITTGDLYAWDSSSTYIQRPPFLEGITADAKLPKQFTARLAWQYSVIQSLRTIFLQPVRSPRTVLLAST